LGDGDIPIVAIMGGILGIKFGMVAIFLASILAIIPALYSSIKKSDIETPFIPFLTLGLFITYIYSYEIEQLLRKINL
jgi:leader peptidase (prepilin peptidase)/N-methyltransferase